MLETKAMIIHEILKKDQKPFKARHVWEPLGMSTQNVGNHLSRLVSKGILIKTGQTYMAPNTEALIEELVTASEKVRLERAEDVAGLSFSVLNDYVDQIVRARVLELDGAIESHIRMNGLINEATDQLKLIKKWLNNKSYSEKRAASEFDEAKWKEISGYDAEIVPKKKTKEEPRHHYDPDTETCLNCDMPAGSFTQFVPYHRERGLKVA